MHWLSAVIAVTLLPKCMLCVAGYLAVVAGLGVATPELCGAVPVDSPWSQGWILPVAAAVSVGVFRLMVRQHTRS